MLRSPADGYYANDEPRNLTSDFARLTLRVCAEIADGGCTDVSAIIRATLDEICRLQSADHGFWIPLFEGVRKRVLVSTGPYSNAANQIHPSLDTLPWCRIQLAKDRPVVVRNTGDLVAIAPIDHYSLYSQSICSIALFPNISSAGDEYLLGVVSTSPNTKWPDSIVNQCALLGDILYQSHRRQLEQGSAELSGLDFERMAGRIRRSQANPASMLMSNHDISKQPIAEHELTKNQSQIKTLAARLLQLQENERKRIARELRDDIGQRLSLVASDIALLASQHQGSCPALATRMDALHGDLASLCSDIHSLSHTLHSFKLQHLGLKAALRELCSRLTRPSCRISLSCGPWDPPSAEIALCFYRIAQEALNNALRYAQASSVTITCTRILNDYSMTIQDCGIGFDLNATRPGLGLVSMRERLTLVNGQLEIQTSPGRGTCIRATIFETMGICNRYRAGSASRVTPDKSAVA